MDEEYYNIPIGTEERACLPKSRQHSLSSSGKSINSSPRNQTIIPEEIPKKTTHLSKAMKPSTPKVQNEDLGSTISNIKRL